MSVALFIESATESVTRPVATESFFLNYWLPKAENESFSLIEQLGLGLDVNESNIHELMAELVELRDKVSTYNDVPDDAKEVWLDRLNLLIDTINQWKSRNYISIYIG